MNTNKDKLNPFGSEPELKKAAQDLKKVNEEVKVEANKDLIDIEKIIKENEKEIISQKERIKSLKEMIKFSDIESHEIEIQDAEDLLKYLEVELKDSLELKKRILDLLDDVVMSEAEASSFLEELENEIDKFKENLLHKSKEREN